MATSRPSPRRTIGPIAITVEDWETKAPLGELETKSIAAVKAASEKPKIPSKFSTNEAGPSRPSTPTIHTRPLPGSRPSTPAPASRPSHALHPKQPVQSPQQFFDWFALVDRSVAHSQEAHFREHLLAVSEHLELCDRLVQRIEGVDREVEDMLEGWRTVEEGGKSLQEACQRLLEERERLVELQEAISTRLDYFQELEHATCMLNHPGESLVLQTDFLYMVERVDICIEFLKAHRHYREAEIYLLRFQQCMTRAMTLIKMYFVGSLRALTQDIFSKTFGEGKSDTANAQMHLLYTRFISVSAQVAPLLGELERRARAHPNELEALLAECHAAYFSARKGLLVGRLTEEIRGLDPTHTELVELTRAGCSYIKQLCTDEFNLYRSFFSSGENQLYQYLENLCDYLYDDLRPRILHEPRLTALCEVCTVLQALMVLDIPTLDGASSDSDDDELIIDLDRHRRKGLGKLHISQLLQMSEIRYYMPKAEDLAYPDKLIASRKPPTGYEIREKESISQLFQLSSLEKRDTWFPTLSKTVWPAIFDDLAQEAVNLCRQSLTAASDMIKAKNPPSSALDGYLFLVRHMLILKEMTRNLDLVEREMERGSSGSHGVTDTLASMLNRTTSYLPNSVFQSLGMPQGDENIMDAKHASLNHSLIIGIDLELKRACEAVINHIADPICSPLHNFVERVNAYTNTTKGAPLTSNSWAEQSAAETLESDFRHACQRDLRAAAGRLRLYLEDKRTVDVLLQHVRERAEDEYSVFRDLVWSMYAGSFRERVLSAEGMKDLLSEVCREEPRTG
ncbi:hypothetical protein EW146_g8889 [Bondarzewia mesenterica]|uniref:Conserved oligomeric Golgi complex subunit 3 n=1 Tax=Bondarzewia mesenterica TaxID=1095465 RepID=A0A4S4LC77_9AGAM|nr:hypothetical protein EW146_g8889 [Bondarzewia mesenterica]